MTLFIHRETARRVARNVYTSRRRRRSFGLTRSSTLVCVPTASGGLVGHACAPETYPRSCPTPGAAGRGVARARRATVTSSSPSPLVRTCASSATRGARTHPPNGVRNRVATFLARRRSARRVAADSRRASRHSAPAALRRVNDDRPQARPGVTSRETAAPVVAHVAHSRTCCYILRVDRPAPRPVDARRSDGRVGVLACCRSRDSAIVLLIVCPTAGPVV